MFCPRKNHDCKMMFRVQLKRKDSYVCCGLNNKPTKYKHDNIWLCLSGAYIKTFKLEVTPYEALSIACALTHGVTGYQDEELEVIGKMAQKKKGRMANLRKAKKGKKKAKKSKGKKSKKRR